MFPLSSINVFLDSSSSSPSTSINRVFTSFHGPDVRVTFLSHLRKQFNSHGITMYENQWRRRRQIIAPALAKAIRESRISIVVLSKNYASSSWYLDELLQILKCKENIGQIVMTVFCGIDPYDVWNQTGDFGKAFHKTCAHQKEEKRERWSQALKNVGNIAGEHFRKWDDESELIEKIASEISRYFEGMVGLETHLDKIQSLLHLDNEGDAMIVGICGPAGIGKTTIARALHSRLSCSFRRTCFMENLRGSYNSGLDEYGLKLHLQEQLLSKILNRNGMRIYHLGELKKRLCDQKVLIILDDVNDLKQLEALADKTAWFGPGSRIVVITEDQELLQKHGINGTYHVNFPSSEEALQILCKYAFDQRYPPNGFQELAERVVGLCDNNLPSSLSVVGSSLCGRKEEEWDKVIRRLEHIMDHQDIEEVLRFVFEPSSSNKRIGKGKHRCFTCMAFLVIFNFLLEIASAVVEHLSSIRKPYFARISVAMSFLSVILSILDLFYKIRDHKARFRFKWPIPWFYYYPKRGYRRVRILGNFTDTVLLFCAVGGFIVSTVNWRFIEKGREGPIKASVWPLFFAIGMVGMVVYEFIQEKPSISKDYYWLEKIRID